MIIKWLRFPGHLESDIRSSVSHDIRYIVWGPRQTLVSKGTYDPIYTIVNNPIFWVMVDVCLKNAEKIPNGE